MGKTMHKPLPKRVLKAASLEFEPCKIGTKGPEGLPSNERFGEQMPYVRLAAVFLTKPKPKLVEMIREFAKSDEAIQGHIETVKSMEHCETVLREFADMIGSARAQLYIANCTAEIETATP
jgi:hypothetical protein